jgi:hypothetical protein
MLHLIGITRSPDETTMRKKTIQLPHECEYLVRNGTYNLLLFSKEYPNFIIKLIV